MKKVKGLSKNKLKYIFPAILLLLIIVAIVCVIVFRGGSLKKNLNSYSLKLSFDEENHLLSGNEKVTYYNNSENMFNSLYFHLYPNAFREGSKLSVVSTTDFAKAYPNGQSYGNIEIKNVYNGVYQFKYSLQGEEMNILEVKLEKPLYPDEKVEINIDFDVTLANVNHRLGYGENTINFGNFYPIACVYEDGKGFSMSPYHSNGDPFYSECANYEVEISYANGFEIASTGSAISQKEENGFKTATFKGENVRDFAFVLSKNFEKVSKKVDGVNVNYYGYKGDKNLDNPLKVSADALKTFNNYFGEYPYKELNVVKTNFVHGGMEYPELVYISDDISDEKDLNYVIVHEIAHQWWYGVVGNDEYNHAWIDEGLAEYSTLLFFEENKSYGENYKTMIANAQKNYLTFEDVFEKVTGEVDRRMDRPINEFATEPEYSLLTYTKSVLMFNSLRDLLGKNRLKKVFRNIYEDYQFKIISPEELIALFVREGGREMESFFNNWLQGKIIELKN